ncbi:hypothetical protein [Treponema pedis]|uniref:hypothetical protein n=1 Tax=Treponema pedis TaxID=409322 RepID=UPI0003F9BE82|nr:hypothetical protein [Treponema pedis]
MKKVLIIILLICLAAFTLYCENSSYIKYANDYNVSEYDIKNILGIYMEEDRKGLSFWVETKFSWGLGVTNTFRTPIQIDICDDEYLYVVDMIQKYKVLEIIKVSDNNYKLNTRYIGELANNETVDVCFDLDFADIETVEMSYVTSLVEYRNRVLPLHMVKLSGPLIKHKPLAGNYVVAVTPYAKDGRVYDSFEALNKGEKEYARKKMKQKKSNKQ